MTKYYTAVGKFIHPSEGQGHLNPSVIVGNNECLLDPQELIIWASLSWRFLKLDEIGKYYEKEASVFDYTNERSWEKCLERLMVRGLVVCGSGETDYDALYDLLSPLFIIPLTGNVTARFFTYAKLTLLHHVPAADATTTKEQPPFLKAGKPLVLLDFQHFRVFRKNGIPATI